MQDRSLASSNHKRYYRGDKHGLLFMDPNTPTSTNPQPDNGLIMPDQPAVTAEPTPIPVSTPAPAPAPVAAPAPAPAPVAPASVASPEPTTVPVNVAPAVEPAAMAAPEPEVAPVVAPEPIPEPTPEPASDPLFDPVTEEDPLDVVPQPVAPTPTAPVTDQAMNQLDDGAQPVVAATGQTVVATSKPHKSRKKMMIMLIVGLLLLGGAGYAAYTFFMKPNVSETATPAAILSVDQLSPEGLAQATDKGELAAASQTNAKLITFSGKTPTDAPSGLKLQIEIQPLGTDFTGTPTEDTVAVPDDADPLKLTVTDYTAGSYHWRGRLSDGTSNGPWVAYNTGDTAGKTADFTVDRTAPAAALIKTSNGKTVAGKLITSTVAQPVLAGTSEPGSAITAAFNETLSYKATVAADGSWTLTAGAVIPNAKYTLTVTAADPAGNATATTYTFTQAAK